MRRFLCSLMLLSSLCFAAADAAETQPFTFSYDDLTYSGEVMLPEAPARGIVIIIPGDGPTEFVGGNQFLGEREFLVRQGFNVAYWDKAGCGKSEGTYNQGQSITSSAQEAIAAIEAVQGLGLSGSDRIGAWGISRGGWVVPKITELSDTIEFWISVSGTVEVNNARYMLEANLRAEERDEEEIALLMSEWDENQRIFTRGGSLAEYNAATQNLMKDPYYNSNNFQMTAETLAGIQSWFQSGEMEIDDETNQIVVYPDLESTLSALAIPVLAVLGRKDTQVDWQAAGELYQRAAESGDMQLTTVYLDDCNHVMQRSLTGYVYEELPPDSPACDGYYEALESWLALNVPSGN
ncbi:MAG: CocE/NonD family hydrolase [Pseudomonadota bacterium]